MFSKSTFRALCLAPLALTMTLGCAPSPMAAGPVHSAGQPPASSPGQALAPAVAAPAAVVGVKGRTDYFGQPFAGADVKVYHLGSQTVSAVGRTNVDGSFAIDLPASIPQGAALKVVVTRGAESLSTVAISNVIAGRTGNIIASNRGINTMRSVLQTQAAAYDDVLISISSTMATAAIESRLMELGSEGTLRTDDIVAKSIADIRKAFAELSSEAKDLLTNADPAVVRAMLLSADLTSSSTQAAAIENLKQAIPSLGALLVSATNIISGAVNDAFVDKQKQNTDKSDVVETTQGTSSGSGGSENDDDTILNVEGRVEVTPGAVKNSDAPESVETYDPAETTTTRTRIIRR